MAALTAAYKEALERCHDVVEQESPFSLYLAFCGGNRDEASCRLATAWKLRLELFGPMRAFRSMQGGGALSVEDLEAIRSGVGGRPVFRRRVITTAAPQPDSDAPAIPFLLLDSSSKRSEMWTIGNRNRALFHTLRMLSLRKWNDKSNGNPQSPTIRKETVFNVGMIVVLDESRDDETTSDYTLSLVEQAVQALCLRFVELHVVLLAGTDGPPPDAKKETVKGAASEATRAELWQAALNRPPKAVLHSRCILQSLEACGFCADDLPTSCGGNWAPASIAGGRGVDFVGAPVECCLQVTGNYSSQSLAPKPQQDGREMLGGREMVSPVRQEEEVVREAMLAFDGADDDFLNEEDAMMLSDALLGWGDSDERNHTACNDQTFGFLEEACASANNGRRSLSRHDDSDCDSVGLLQTDYSDLISDERTAGDDAQSSPSAPQQYDPKPQAISTLGVFAGDPVHEAMAWVDDTVARAYYRAIQQCPLVVKLESPHDRYLKFCQQNCWGAAKRLAMYWSKRVEVFGEQAAFGPVSDALLEDDKRFLCSGAVVFLGLTRNGHPSLFLDRSGNADDPPSSRAIWCIYQRLGELAESFGGSEAVFVLCLRMWMPKLPGSGAFSLVRQLIQDLLCFRVVEAHIMAVHQQTGIVQYLLDLAVPCALRRMAPIFGKDKLFVHMGPPADVLEQLRKHGFEESILPTSCGGKWHHEGSGWSVLKNGDRPPLIQRSSKLLETQAKSKHADAAGHSFHSEGRLEQSITAPKEPWSVHEKSFVPKRRKRKPTPLRKDCRGRGSCDQVPASSTSSFGRGRETKSHVDAFIQIDHSVQCKMEERKLNRRKRNVLYARRWRAKQYEAQVASLIEQAADLRREQVALAAENSRLKELIRAALRFTDEEATSRAQSAFHGLLS